MTSANTWLAKRDILGHPWDIHLLQLQDSRIRRSAARLAGSAGVSLTREGTSGMSRNVPFSLADTGAYFAGIVMQLSEAGEQATGSRRCIRNARKRWPKPRLFRRRPGPARSFTVLR